MGRVRYDAACVGDRWTETGEMQPRTAGAAPVPFFELTLQRDK